MTADITRATITLEGQVEIKHTDGAVQGKNGVWVCHECEKPHAIKPFTTYLSRVRCCGRVYDLQNWDWRRDSGR